jgi:hypothetical protein
MNEEMRMVQAVDREHLEVAVAFLPLIDHVVEEVDARIMAVDDVVRRWRGLDPRSRRRYEQERRPPGWTPVMTFAEEFFQAMDDEATRHLEDMLEGTVISHPDDGEPYEPLEAARINHWRAHLDQYREAGRQDT